MLLGDVANIREVIAFPTLRPERRPRDPARRAIARSKSDPLTFSLIASLTFAPSE